MKLRYIFFWLMLLAGCPRPLPAADLFLEDAVDFDLFINDRIHSIHDFYDSGRQRFSEDRNLHITFVNPRVSALLAPHLLGVFEIEAELLYDIERSVGEDDIDIRNAYLQWLVPGTDWATLIAGRQFLRTFDGLIYDESAPALRLQLDFERGFDLPYRFEIFIAEIDRDSPYVHTGLRYQFSFFEQIGLSFGWYRDACNGLGRVYNSLARERRYRSRGDLYWYGLSLKKFLGPFLLRSNFIYERGRVRVRGGDFDGSKTVRAYLFDINLDYSISKRCSLSVFFYLASGDRRPENGTFRTFISIDPYVEKTNIFFNGGVDGQFSSDHVALNGMQPAGVMAPGFTVDWRPRKDLQVRLVGAYLLTHTGTGARGHRYGWEADVMGYYNLTDSLQLFLELNVFDPDDYFRDITLHREHTSSEIILGCSYFFSL